MIELSRGDIWLVSLDPTIGHEINKSRPALIVQNNLGNKYSQTTIIAPITSQNIQRIHPFEVFINGLEKESKALLNQIRCIDKRRLIKKLIRLDQETMLKIDDALRISLEL